MRSGQSDVHKAENLVRESRKETEKQTVRQKEMEGHASREEKEVEINWEVDILLFMYRSSGSSPGIFVA